MSTPWAQTTVLSTAQGAGVGSTPIALDPLAKMTTVQVTLSSVSVSATFYVQATLDGNGAWGSGGVSTLQPTPQPLWGIVGGSSVGGIFQSSAATSSGAYGLNTFDGSATFVLLQPVAGLRLISSGSSAITSGGSVILRALQSPAA